MNDTSKDKRGKRKSVKASNKTPVKASNKASVKTSDKKSDKAKNNKSNAVEGNKPLATRDDTKIPSEGFSLTWMAIALVVIGIAVLVYAGGVKFKEELVSEPKTESATSKSNMSINSSIEKEVIGEVVGFDRLDQSEACEFVSSITGDNSRQVVSFGTEAGLFQEVGISTVVCGPGSIEQAHKIDEFIELNELKKCLKFLEGVKDKSIN